jgi:hypothetical protein
LGLLAKYLYKGYTKAFIAGYYTSLCVDDKLNKIYFLRVYVAWGLHLGEAIYALTLTTSIDTSLQCKVFWFIQTFLFGYPSLGMLRQHIKSIKTV